jgi:hypothetical protein
MERQVIQPEDLLAIFAIETCRCIRSIHWLRHKAQILAALGCLRPIWDMWVQIGQDELDATSWFRQNSRRSRREAFGVRRCWMGRAGYTRIELCVQVFLDEWGWTSCAGTKVHICVAGHLGVEGSIEGACDELCRRGFLQKRDTKSPGEGKAGLDFLAEILREPWSGRTISLGTLGVQLGQWIYQV